MKCNHKQLVEPTMINTVSAKTYAVSQHVFTEFYYCKLIYTHIIRSVQIKDMKGTVLWM
jgi:hypothetical protein